MSQPPTPAPVHAVTQGGVDPLWVLWEALGGPPPTDAAMDRTGTCTRCGAFSTTASRVKATVSDKFTGWEAYTQTWDPLWCVPCAWGHTASEVRTRPWIIGADRTAPADPAALTSILASGLDPHAAVMVPISRHKHVLPAAKWGHVATDDRALAWTSDEAHRFRTLAWFRGLGFNEAALAQPTPRFEQFITLDAPTMRLAMTRWATLSEWRKDLAYLKVACVASRTTKQAVA